MLEEIRVRDLALIEDVRLELGPGMTVLTGETGAGKTALVGAIKLLIGERADSTLVRAGAARDGRRGRFLNWTEHSMWCDAEYLPRADRSAPSTVTCRPWASWPSDSVASSTFTASMSTRLFSTLRPTWGISTAMRATPRRAALDRYREARAAYAGAHDELERIEREVSETAEKAEYLRFVIEEIERVGPELGEDDEIHARMPGLVHGEKLTEAAAEAHAALSTDGGASDAIATSGASLSRVADLDPRLDEMAERLAALSTEIDELALELREYAEGLEHDPAALDAAQQRLAMLDDIRRKHGATLEEVLATADRAQTDLDRLEHGDEEAAAARARVDDARERLQKAAGEARRAARCGRGRVRRSAVCCGGGALDGTRPFRGGG